MNLPANFSFSQSSLQDFEVCPRRFQLRYIEQLRWPAVESEPVEEAERLAQLGTDFHRLVQQHLIGLDEATLAQTVAHAEPDLQRWWQNYLVHRPVSLAEATVFPELTLSMPQGGFRLLSKFDVLARWPDGRWLIIDWKTAHKKPPRSVLERRMQSRVYPYVLASAGTSLNQGRPIKPDTITMMYWYPQFPTEPEKFSYSQKSFKRDETALDRLIERVKAAARQGNFPLVADERPCVYCVYRSYCARDVAAGPLLQQDEAVETSLDVLSLEWDQIAEIQF